MVDRKWRVHRDTLDEFTARFPDLPLAPPIPRAADFPRARSVGLSIFDFAPNSLGAKRYADLARLVMRESGQELVGRKSAELVH